MLSLPVTFLEDSDLFNRLASRDSGPKRRRELLEYRDRTDGILEETWVSFSREVPLPSDNIPGAARQKDLVVSLRISVIRSLP